MVDGRFCHAECSCGWRGAGRRLRSTARTEARDHALLYVGAEAGSDVRADAADAAGPEHTPAP